MPDPQPVSVRRGALSANEGTGSLLTGNGAATYGVCGQ
jgi:hypothetical protein